MNESDKEQRRAAVVRERETADEIRQLVRRAVKSGAEAFVRSVDYREDGWKPLAVRVDVARPGDVESSLEARYGQSVRCGQRRFDEAEVEGELLPALLDDAPYSMHEDTVTLETFSPFSSPQRLSRPSEWCAWPCFYTFRHGTQQSPKPALHVLASGRFPFFSSVRELCSQVIGLPGQRPDWREAQKLMWLHLVIWDYRARFRDIRRQDDHLVVELLGNAVADTLVVGRCDYPNGESVQIRECGAPEVRAPLDSPPASLQLAIIDERENLIADFHESVYTTPVLRRRVVEGSNAAAVEKLAELQRAGEGQSVEFKEWVDLRKGSKKKWEVVKTAVAMANTMGGVILVGIDDYGSVQDWPPDGPVAASLREFGVFPDPGHGYSNGLRNLLGRYGGALRDLVQRHVSDHIAVEVEVVELGSNPIVLLDIVQGSRQPYAFVKNGKHEYFVRRGATTRPPTVDEMRELCWTPHQPAEEHGGIA